MQTTVIGNTTTEPNTITHATEREAQLYAARRELEAAGWSVRGPASSDGHRRPLLLPGESMRTPLDGRRSDERAQGLCAWSPIGTICVDACAGLPIVVLWDEGDTASAREILAHYLGSLG